VAFSHEGGPDELKVFVVGQADLDQESLLSSMNGQLKRLLNPLFKVSQVRVVAQLPRTVSGKVMRRELRAQP
jgi:acyl-coenzyme A synthetase/AMP-(fatty) acid ligase